MTKSKSTQPAKNAQPSSPLTTLTKNPILLIGLALLVVVVGVILVTSNSNQATRVLITPSDYQTKFTTANTEHLLLDVRTPEEFATGHIHGAVNISVESLADRLSEVPQGIPVVVYCRSGNRSVTASKILTDAGYKEVYDLGGINAWQAQGLPIE